jgi:hypothetical protein
LNYTDVLPVGAPVVVRSYVSGVFVGRLRAGEAGVVVLAEWRHLRSWTNAGGQGSVYNLVHASTPTIDAGPLTAEETILQQADVLAISEECYARLTSG